MSHSLRILGKAINDLKFFDVQDFFKLTREEHLNLDFKSNLPRFLILQLLQNTT